MISPYFKRVRVLIRMPDERDLNTPHDSYLGLLLSPLLSPRPQSSLFHPPVLAFLPMLR
jgi:hypothetical protein